jgi:CheY-like chemotaxis protein
MRSIIKAVNARPFRKPALRPMSNPDMETKHEALRTILLVDDDAFSTRILKTLLERTGRYVVSLENESTHALDAAVRLRPDLVLMDVVMPGVDGRTLAYQMRADPLIKETPIVFLSGIVPKESANPHRMLGEFPVVPKPVHIDEVIQCIEENLCRKDET